VEVAEPVNYPERSDLIKCRHCGTMLGGLHLVGDEFEHRDPRHCWAIKEHKKRARLEEMRYLRAIRICTPEEA
jgi:Ser/Thr protein kinase RdoA (MazF antagonist)